MDIATPSSLLLLAQAPIALTGNPALDSWVQLGAIGFLVWILFRQNERAAEAKIKADADKDVLLHETMGRVEKTFEKGFTTLQECAKDTSLQIRDLKQWIVDEIQDARKVRDSDPTRTNDRKDN